MYIPLWRETMLGWLKASVRVHVIEIFLQRPQKETKKKKRRDSKE